MKPAAPLTTKGPRPMFPMDTVQIIKSTAGAFFVSFNGDNGHGPFKTREKAQEYAQRTGRAAK